MKKLASILAVTLAAGVLATGCGSSSGSASKDSSSDSGKTVIKAATGANAKPYVYVGDDDKPAGYDVDVLNAVFDKLPDYELEYEVTDFGSVLSGLNSGNYQIRSTTSLTTKTVEQVIFTLIHMTRSAMYS